MIAESGTASYTQAVCKFTLQYHSKSANIYLYLRNIIRKYARKVLRIIICGFEYIMGGGAESGCFNDKTSNNKRANGTVICCRKTIWQPEKKSHALAAVCNREWNN